MVAYTLVLQMETTYMATFRKRGDRIQAIVRKQTPDKLNQIVERQTFPTKAKAISWAHKLELSIEAGEYPPANSTVPRHNTAVSFEQQCNVAKKQEMTLRELVHQYTAKVSVRHKGYAVEVDTLRRIMDGSMGRKPLIDADQPISSYTPQQFSQYRDDRLAQVSIRGSLVNDGTVRREMSLLGCVFKAARDEWGLISTNPLHNIRKPKEPRGRDRRLKPDEIDSILNNMTNERAKDAILLALHTGMRRSEISRVKPENVNLNKRTLYLDDTKNGERREVPLGPEAINILNRCLQRVGLMGFKTLFGLNHISITHAFEAACKKAGVEGLRFHDLRHEATSRFFEIGLGIPDVAAITGHKTWTALKRYTQLKPETIAEKLAKAYANEAESVRKHVVVKSTSRKTD
jgi:integrase